MTDSKSTKVETYPLIVKMIPDEIGVRSRRISEKTVRSQPRISEKIVRSQRTIRLGNRSTIAAVILSLWCFSNLFLGGSIASTVLTAMQTPENTTTTTATPNDRLVIIARYDEDVSWAPMHLDGRIPYEVCQKGNSTNPLPGFYVTPNRGQEALCYLSAIIRHYHNLPDQMAFVHGHRSAWHEPDNALNLLSYQWEKRLPYASLSTVEFTRETPFPDGAQVCLKKQYCNNQAIGLQGRQTSVVWYHLLSPLLNMTKPGTIRSSCCAQFVVTKESILEHPLETYKTLQRYLVETNKSDYWMSRVFEYTWHILFGMPAYYIDPPKCERFHCNSDGERIIPGGNTRTTTTNSIS